VVLLVAEALPAGLPRPRFSVVGPLSEGDDLAADFLEVELLPLGVFDLGVFLAGELGLDFLPDLCVSRATGSSS
jgi:hypothetical protein